MWRCEEEIVLKVSASNVVCILVAYYHRLSKHLAFTDDPVVTPRRNIPGSPVAESSSSSNKEESKEQVTNAIMTQGPLL